MEGEEDERKKMRQEKEEAHVWNNYYSTAVAGRLTGRRDILYNIYLEI